MPYITQESRDNLVTAQNGGDLNYQISMLCARYIMEHGLRYKNISDVVGALEGAKQEFFRKVVDPYENLKEMQNGGVYNKIEEEIEDLYCDSEPAIHHFFNS